MNNTKIYTNSKTDLIDHIIAAAHSIGAEEALDEMGRKLWTVRSFNERCLELEKLISEHITYQSDLLKNGRKLLLRKKFYHYKDHSYDKKWSGQDAIFYFEPIINKELPDLCESDPLYTTFFGDSLFVTSNELRIARIDPDRPSSQYIHSIRKPRTDILTFDTLQREYSLPKALELLGEDYLLILLHWITSNHRDNYTMALLAFRVTTSMFYGSEYETKRNVNFSYHFKNNCKHFLALRSRLQELECDFKAISEKSQTIERYYASLSAL